MQVTVKETVAVRPARPTPRRILWCSNLDQIQDGFVVHTVYFYQPPNGLLPESFFNAGALKAALAEVLVPFYPAAGRRTLDVNGRPEIDCNGEGVVFMEAEANVGLGEFGDFGPENTTKYTQLVPRVPAFRTEHDISASPLLLLQVTRFNCGGAALGVAFDHLLGDGLAQTQMINAWADATRGALPVPQPFVDRTILAARDSPAPSFTHPEYHVPPPTIGSTGPLMSEQTFVAASFTLTPADIGRLKTRLTEVSGERCGAYEAIVTHVWRCACIARGLPADQKTRVFMPVSLLPRFNPPLPGLYLGNAILRVICDATAGEVEEWGATVTRVRVALAQIDEAYARSLMDFLQLQPDLSKLRRGPHTFSSPNLNVNSWVKLPVYGADFGWGRPVFAGPAMVRSEGMIIVLPRPAPEDGLSLHVGLHPPAMEKFRNVFYDF